jgi:LDH2 family malate/lactate/ureidoglycolate dehydrogenase
VTTFTPESLRDFTVSLARAMGAPPAVAAEVGQHLLRAHLSGHESHGFARMLQYDAEAQRGDLAPSALPEVLSGDGATALIDAHRGFGHWSARFGLEWCLGRVHQYGIAVAALRHCTHLGRLGEYAERAAERGCVSIITLGVAGHATGGAAPFGSRVRFLGTNPWCVGIPGADGEPAVVDMATTAVAGGKVHLARARGDSLPPGAISDSEGRPSTDPEDYYKGGAFQPAAGHKGYGLALMAALLGGLAMIGDPAPTSAGASSQGASSLDETGIGGALMITISPDAFGPPDVYRGLVGTCLEMIRSLDPAAGNDRVRVPGDPEREARARGERDGVRLPEGIVTQLSSLADSHGVRFPSAAV